MPVVDRSNNRILPANSRAADVATQAIKEITPVQQARYYNAFRPQGISCVLYNHLTAGRKCSCQASGKQLNARLDKQGKAPPTLINQLLTGQSFNIDPYGVTEQLTNQVETTSPDAPYNQNQGVFDIVTDGDEFPFARTVEEPDFGDNGPINPVIDIDDLVGEFDASVLGFSDAACPVCFGTGFIGGYTPFQAHRHVLAVNDVSLQDGEIDPGTAPWTATCTSFEVAVTLPRGAIGVDSFRVLNGIKGLGALFYVDGQRVNGPTDLLARCDGAKHVLRVEFTAPTKWTHIEFQFNVTTESTFFEFPRLASSSDTALLEQTEPFQIVMSPNVPQVDPMDIITESMFGKTLIVTNSNWWNSRDRQLLGWECQVRVLQPQEIYRILPFRGRTLQKPPTTNKVRDNVTGPRRT